MAKSPIFIVTGMSSCQRSLTETIWQRSNNGLLRSRTCRRNPAFKLPAEIVEHSFAHNLDRRGMRRTWLRERENVHMRYLLHVTGHNLSLLMRQLIGAARRGRPWPADMAVSSCSLRLLAPFWSLRYSSSSRRMAKPPSPRYVSSWGETRPPTTFSTG